MGVDALGAKETTTDIWGVIRTPVENRFQTYSEIVYHPLAEVKSVVKLKNLHGQVSIGTIFLILQADTPTKNILAMYHASGSFSKEAITVEKF